MEEALATARGLALPVHHLPSLPIKMIGKLSGLPLERAESINENIDKARRSKGTRHLRKNKLHFVFLRMGCWMLCGKAYVVGCAVVEKEELKP